MVAGGRPGKRPPAGRPVLAEADFARAPFLVIWETTRACDLACLHCRASARAARDPRELDTAEAKDLIASVRALGNPLFVLTGGDPLRREDTVELVAHAAASGLRVAMTPSGTPLMTPGIVRDLRDAGLARLAVSLDGSCAEIHDRFRGVSGSFEWTVRMIRAARDLGVGMQVNTTISRHNAGDLDALIALMETLGVVLWSVFFVVPTGRARASDLIGAGEVERVFHRLYDLSRVASFDIKTTAAPHYRRVVMQRQRAERRAGVRVEAPSQLGAGVGFSAAGGVGRAKGVNDGDGFVFVSHTGEIQPSGFLPLSAGNVRRDVLGDVYRSDPLFVALRDRDRLKGKCGVCEFRAVCGGSRARAYAMTGDHMESDPSCAYVPPAYARLVASGAAERADAYFASRVKG